MYKMGLIPPFYFDCVVAIGQYNQEKKFEGIASGFLYGNFLEKLEHGATYSTFLVTNKHVFEGLDEVILRFNPQNIIEPAKDYPLRLKDDEGKPDWKAHPNTDIDVAATTVNFNVLEKEGMQAHYFCSDLHVADIQKINDLGIMEGDGVYVLGFPLGLVGKTRSEVIARGGSIARIREASTKESFRYLIDLSVFPGNSGSPVISKPELISVKGTKSMGASLLIGIVSSYVPYREVAISQQTHMPRIVFEENSGLTWVHPVDCIKEVIQLFPTPTE